MAKDTGTGRKRKPFIGFPILNFQNLMSDHDEGQIFFRNLRGFQDLRHELRRLTGKPLMSSVEFTNAVLGKHHYTATTYRRYYIWEFENHRIVANKDYGYDIEIRGDIDGMIWSADKNQVHLKAKKEHIWKVWAEARKPFEEFVFANAVFSHHPAFVSK